MADVRTEREKLVQALADLVVQELADSLPSGRAEGAAALLNGTEYEDLYVAEDEEIRAAVRLAAADLLSEEGEPEEDVTARALRSAVSRYKQKLDTSGDPAARYTYRNVVDDLEGILRAADLRAEMRPGPVQEASEP